MVEARDNGDEAVHVWGTGKATREFLYAEDAAQGILLAAEKYDGEQAVNLGTGDEITIADLAEKIRHAVGFEGCLEFDSSQPDGQPRRVLSTSRANDLFGFKSETDFDQGLRTTVEWFENNLHATV